MEKKSKLVLAVLQGSDSDNTIRNLNERGFMVTVLSSTGGFLKKKSTTVMIGVEEDRLEEALDVLQKYAGHWRPGRMAFPSSAGRHESAAGWKRTLAIFRTRGKIRRNDVPNALEHGR